MTEAANTRSRAAQAGDSITGRECADIALKAALDKHALDPVLFDIGQQCSYAQYLLLLSARSERQVSAIAESILVDLKAAGAPSYGVEGRRSANWSLLDFGDLIVHVFLHSTREHYDLEGLWVDAKRVEIEVPPEARISPHQMYDH